MHRPKLLSSMSIRIIQFLFRCSQHHHHHLLKRIEAFKVVVRKKVYLTHKSHVVCIVEAAAISGLRKKVGNCVNQAEAGYHQKVTPL